MTADQPLITHADLEPLRHARAKWLDGSSVADVLDRLIQAAEADKPALPEGWVLADGAPRWHDGKGRISVSRSHAPWTNVSDWRSVTPLVTAASLVPEGWHVLGGIFPRLIDGDGNLVIDQEDVADPVWDVLAALVSAAQAERGESR